MHQKILLVIAGPTASGKTALAVQLAQHFNTEIVSADSRQLYNELPIGSAAPTAIEQASIKHHFVGCISIHQDFDVATYEKMVLELLNQIFEHHSIVILAGGSGLFVDAVCNGLDTLPETTAVIRKEVQAIYSEKGLVGLQEKVKILDPKYFGTLDIHNPRRLQRALEVCLQTGTTYSSFRTRTKKKRPFRSIRIALQCDRAELINRINRRVDKMMTDGLLDEATKLYNHRHVNALNTVGYKELFTYLHADCSLEQAIAKIKINPRRYAKRQMTWFRKNDDYTWFRADEPDKIIQFIEKQIQHDSLTN